MKILEFFYEISYAFDDAYKNNDNHQCLSHLFQSQVYNPCSSIISMNGHFQLHRDQNCSE